MTNEQITSRCQNCGGTKKEHAVRKPWKCDTRLGDTNWEPWTVEQYNEATAVHRARMTRPEPTPAVVEMPRPQEPRTLDITPNFGMLFTQFARDAEQAGALLAASICSAQFDVYPETERALAQRAGVLRAVQGFLAPATIALQAATNAAAIERLRDVMAGVLAKLNQQASEFEAMAADLAPEGKEN